MSTTSGNVSGNPLNVLIDYYAKSDNENADNAHYKETKDSLLTLLQQASLLPPELTQQFDPLLPLLINPLGVLFNTLWLSVLSVQETALANLFQKQVGSSVNSVTATLVPTGTLMAEAATGTSSVPGSLTLTFQLPGDNIHFEHGGVTAWYKLDFDAALVIWTTVPLQPFNLSPTVSAQISNTSLHADSFWADVETGLDDFFTALGNFFTQSDNYISDWNLAQNAVGQYDESYSLPQDGLTQILNAITSLNAASPYLLNLGFVQCDFSVVNGDALTLTIKHPLDAAPKLTWPGAPQTGILLLQPTLAASDPAAKPGQSITASGANFPLALVSQVPLSWSNSSSGTPSGAQIKYEIKGKNTASPINVPASDLAGGDYSYTAKSLAADTDYTFWARCGDALTWSEWSEIQIKTAQSATVNLVLKSQATGAAVTIGSAPLSETATGWSANGIIPAGTAPGTYNLLAVRADNNLEIAMTTITIADSLQPTLFFVDPSHGDSVISSPLVLGGGSFAVKGEYFPASAIIVNVNGDTGVITEGPEFVLSLTAPGSPENSEEVTVTALSTVAPVTITFDTLGEPK